MTFLQKNLTALASKPLHAPLVTFLQNYQIKTPEAIAVYETEAGDLSLALGDKAVHSLQGAQAEAETLVEQGLNPNPLGQTVLLGLGLGYTLQSTVALAKQQNTKGAISVYEPNLDLLAFTLQNVDLSPYWQDDRVQLLVQENDLLRFVMSKYLQGDGFGVIYTPGYMNLETEAVSSALSELKKHAESTQRNAFLLQERGKQWTEHFLLNVGHLPQTRPVDAFSGLFKGKTLVLAGAGPSLDDAIPHLKTIADKVVIMAVSGAVRPLVQAGIVPDFVTFMDFIGPSKHLFGVEDSLKDSEFIVGPSAQTYIYSLKRQNVWLGAMHFNEQFNYLLDNGFARPELPKDRTPLYRYQTGGTVSMYTLQIAYEMGFDHFILTGQDLALRGDKIYAGGIKGQISASGKIEMAATESNVARNITLTEVMGQNGQMIQTQDDYAHFIKNFVNTGRLLREAKPEASLYNCSVGGALLENWEHAPIEAAWAALPAEAKAPVNKATVIAQAKEKIAVYTDNSVAEGLRQGIEKLYDELKTCHRLAGEAKLQAAKLQEMSPTQWPTASAKYSGLFNEFSAILEGNKLLHDTYYHEQLALRHFYKENATSTVEIRANFKLDEQYFERMLAQFETDLLPQLEAALGKLNEHLSVV